jgi:hypothetical protein
MTRESPSAKMANVIIVLVAFATLLLLGLAACGPTTPDSPTPQNTPSDIGTPSSRYTCPQLITAARRYKSIAIAAETVTARSSGVNNVFAAQRAADAWASYGQVIQAAIAQECDLPYDLHP